MPLADATSGDAVALAEMWKGATLIVTTLIGAWVTVRLSKAAGSRVDPVTPVGGTITVPTPAGDRTLPIGDQDPALIGILEQVVATQKDTQSTVAGMQIRLAKQASLVGRLQARLAIVVHDRDALVEHVSSHIAWEDAGRPDPPGAPETTARLRVIVHRAQREDDAAPGFGIEP